MSFHQFNPFTGRLKPATQSQAFYPLAPSKLQIADPIMVTESKPKSVQSSNVKMAKASSRIAELQKKFQADLSKPSYLLAGTRDVIIYRSCIALTAMSFLANMYYMIQLHKKF
ncbi:uncharacterized protein LOC114877464 isoform X1 [Osmia bicornis bicornis]|uniref:uncharacterized protein LOC114877464 isoform X1 n=1 Tax=Osmia bicornis bicornis TaxID=1437191 RepID=UPI0010F54AB8|nr:uncharacterized protein LOC114877464 isoform X1 [Osmia bicornis bicornis]